MRASACLRAGDRERERERERELGGGGRDFNIFDVII